MPELPEVETTRRGIAPYLQQRKVLSVVIRQPRLRWPVPKALSNELPSNVIRAVERRGKYLLLDCTVATAIIHLGMSGSLRIVDPKLKPAKHDHFDFVLDSSKVLRYTDPRRFGCLLWHSGDIHKHWLIDHLGPEPLTDDFSGELLHESSRKRNIAVKPFIMESQVVVGVGNIYANEALFLAGIHPTRSIRRISLARYDILASCIKDVLGRAIKVGGTTLRDFTSSSGEAGYFKQSLFVYGRGGLECKRCGELLKEIRLAQRSTVFCSKCQR